MNSPEVKERRPPWTALLWVRLTVINLLATAAVVVTLTVFIVYRAGTELASLSPNRFLSLQSELRQNLWQGMGELFNVVSRQVLFTSLLGVLLALGFALLLSAIFSRYIGRLIGAIQRVAAGDFTVRIEPMRGPYELGVLERGLNRTAEHLAHLEQERQFEGAVIAHELRTPITALRLRVLGLQDGIYPFTSDELEPLNRQLEHLEYLAESLQTLTLADAGRLNLQLEATDVDEVFGALRATFVPHAERRNLRLSFRTSQPLSFEADPFQLHKALGNLLQNALNHTPAGGCIEMRASVDNSWLRFSVSDTGMGVPGPLMERLFERFYRTDVSRSRAGGGSGLGLAIVQAVAQAHGGQVVASRAVSGGLQIDFDIPLRGVLKASL